MTNLRINTKEIPNFYRPWYCWQLKKHLRNEVYCHWKGNVSQVVQEKQQEERINIMILSAMPRNHMEGQALSSII